MHKPNMCVERKTMPGDLLPGCRELGEAGQPALQGGGERKQHSVRTIFVKSLWPFKFFTAETVWDMVRLSTPHVGDRSNGMVTAFLGLPVP